MKKELISYIKEYKVLEHGTFTLASGKISNTYFDCKKIICNSRGLKLFMPILLDKLAETAHFEAIGGLEAGAIFVSTGILCFADKKGFIVRKQIKDHGTQKYIEGPVVPGMKVAIVEDATTTGVSAAFAIEKAKEFGLIPVVVGSIINRQEGADELFAKMNIPFVYLLTKDEIVSN